jgi:hypothetical protein
MKFDDFECYVVHYTPLVERKKFLLRQFDKEGIIATFVSGGLVSNILAGLMLVNVIGVSVIMATLLEIAKKAHQIDKLDEAARDLYMARRKYDAATEKLVQIQSLVEAEVLDKDK